MYDTITCHQVRALFDGTIESYAETRSRLSPDASIIMHPTFESAIIKIQSDKAPDMSEEEKLIVQGLKREEICKLSNEAPLSFAARALKCVRTTSDCDATYINTRFILPTSNIC